MIGIQHKLIEMTGKRFGRLVVVEQAGISLTKKALWLCRCECGEERIIAGYDLRAGNCRSCGCLRRDMLVERNTTHGKTYSKVYRSWAHVLDRCLNPNDGAFQNYGGRGITVCARWQSFENFLKDMGEPPAGAGVSIERVENNGNYEPGNCCWATQKEQSRNKRNNRFLTFNGVTLCVSDWAKRIGMKCSTLQQRIISGWSAEDALTKPLRRY